MPAVMASSIGTRCGLSWLAGSQCKLLGTYSFHSAHCHSAESFAVFGINNLQLLLLLLKEVGSARLRESDIHPISSKTPAP